MSLKLYQPVDRSGIVDAIYKNTSADTNKYPLMDMIADINLALDNLMSIAFRASGVWQLDDSNHADYPIITTNLISGQRDYSFTWDGAGNLILDIYRVMVADQNGRYYDLRPVDQQTSSFITQDLTAQNLVNGQNLQGYPTIYDKTANGIFLDTIPSYNYTNGLKIFINREASHFSVPTINVADNTMPGIDGRLHEYLVVRPTAYYAARRGLKNYNFWANELLKYEGNEDKGITGMIEETYAKRSRDEMTKVITKYRSSR